MNPRHPRTPWYAAVLAAVAVLLLPGAPAHADDGPIETGPPAAGVTLSGVIDHAGKGDTAAFGAWRGTPVNVIVDYLGGSTWASIENASWTRARWAGTRAHYVWSMFMLPTHEPATVQDCSAQAYNAHYEAAGRSLVAAGYAYSTIRIGWEFTGDWFKWGWKNDQQWFYGTCYRTMVRSLRKAPGQHFTFDWNLSDQHRDPTLGYTTCATGCGAYPGDAYVDFIGGDFYDNETADPTQHTLSWSRLSSGPWGLDQLAAFAAQRGKRVVIPEWGVEWKCSGGWYGGDDPYYVRQMRKWIDTHDVAYEAYFNDDDNACQAFALLGGVHSFPKAADAYKALF